MTERVHGVAIIGAGFSGPAMAIRLKRLDVRPDVRPDVWPDADRRPRARDFELTPS